MCVSVLCVCVCEFERWEYLQSPAMMGVYRQLSRTLLFDRVMCVVLRWPGFSMVSVLWMLLAPVVRVAVPLLPFAAYYVGYRRQRQVVSGVM